MGGRGDGRLVDDVGDEPLPSRAVQPGPDAGGEQLAPVVEVATGPSKDQACPVAVGLQVWTCQPTAWPTR